ncbi:MAG: hypothetical protein ACHQZR_08685 [Candidatus Limnocylindrales bacterium]
MVVATILAAIVVVVLLKPWGDAPRSAVALADPAPSASVATARPSLAVAGDPDWPALAALRSDSTDPVSTAMATQLLAIHAGTWGVGDGGSGPRLIRDGIWSDWVPLVPGPATRAPDALSTALPSGSCAGLPMLDDRPSVLAVTASGDIGAGWRLTAWWSDGQSTLSINGSIRQVVLPGVRGAAYLERLDRAPWPAGRYELHITTGHRTFALTTCVGAP